MSMAAARRCALERWECWSILSDQGNVRAGILEALRHPKGVIHQGLEYFSYINFERQLPRILENVVLTRK
jgi:hypothetical protein